MDSRRRCHYEVLCLSQDCTLDDIRAAYKKLALQCHPDKLVQTGLTQVEAKEKFQEVLQAYTVLSDPKERAWYDSHRSQILFSDSSKTGPGSPIPNLYTYFSASVYAGYGDTGKGFYKVYSDIFEKIYGSELGFCRKLGLAIEEVKEAPVFGNSQSPYEQVTAFYNYWLGFSTVMNFCWADCYDLSEGGNRKSRRAMEEENKKLRKRAKREYNDTVRGLAEFVKKRDKRVIDMMVKKKAEIEKKNEIEREKKKKMEENRMKKMMEFEEPEWTRVNEDELETLNFEEGEKEEKEKGEFYCVICGKKFKSDKQWKNHEQSKKHKERVAEFRESIGGQDTDGGVPSNKDDDDDIFFDAKDEENNEENTKSYINEETYEANATDHSGNEETNTRKKSASNTDINDYGENISTFKADEQIEKVNDTDSHFDENNEEGDANACGFDDGVRNNVVEALASTHVNKKTSFSSGADEELLGEDHFDTKTMEDEALCNGKRRSRRRKKKNVAINSDFGNTYYNNEKDNLESLNQRVEGKSSTKNEKGEKMKKSKSNKGKTTPKSSRNTCETCNEEFESRNRLHKHLCDTGHATLKSH